MSAGFRSLIAGIIGRFSSTPAPLVLSGSGSVQPTLTADWTPHRINDHWELDATGWTELETVTEFLQEDTP